MSDQHDPDVTEEGKPPEPVVEVHAQPATASGALPVPGDED